MLSQFRPDMFHNVRCRMQRLGDMKFFSGWVTSFHEREVLLRLVEETTLEPGTSFHFTVNGPDCSAGFTATLFGVHGDEHVFHIAGPVHFGAPTEEVRYCVEGVVGILQMDGMDVEFVVGDVSRSGIGGYSYTQVERGTKCDFSIDSSFGQIRGSGEVRYCRPDPKDITRYRIGLQVKEIGRIESARWHKMIGMEHVA